MNKLIILLMLLAVGCELKIDSQPSQARTLHNCDLEIEIMHTGGGVNNITYSFKSVQDCYQSAQSLVGLSSGGVLRFGQKNLATSVASYRITN